MIVSGGNIVPGVVPPQESPAVQEEAHDAASWHSKFPGTSHAERKVLVQSEFGDILKNRCLFDAG